MIFFFDESTVVGCPDCGGESYIGVSKYCVYHWRDNWHYWFAWYPVKTLGVMGWTWFTTVYRKPIPKDFQSGTIHKFWYRGIEE